ncbi:MAG: squalene--hopene cyclase [Verrucomicrobia bacterium]|jgi:squalene-hopene/tetraprenyl-beta-curcumene cyclase|nr:squalene--hopene cyclase [Verrucomicrobiota bacterium]OQC62949.1 MAG: Squalene--hopene cyclase [Verrucomicrobia bacterium ADurb.Bin006]MDI9380701.1 prenyltransferase/squalene oxidase repeat-containing protein [Verrucomicrobiota bacterium]NMD21917.1 squalene--hopene cyclase [Verrucomicrobiota bacterium]HNU98316.1 prenyltransferase/squalene oxidase repeat-containing protein [Verrucomicrobiota bacterium]
MSPDPLDYQSIAAAAHNARRALLERRTPDGHWTGYLSSSALSTAVATVALALTDAKGHDRAVRRGLIWLEEHQDADGGWGDTPSSPANLSTTLLSWAAFDWASDRMVHRGACERAERWLEKRLGSLAPDQIADRVLDAYGKDRTFSVPILTFCALCGRLGDPDRAWTAVPQLPFELAAMPHRFFKWLRLPVVSYAVPALIAIGLARHEHTGHGVRPLRRLRDALKPRVLGILREIQPAGGGFLEAIPLTGFVVSALAACGLHGHPVAMAGAEFLLRTVRADGSWPIDVNLSTWVTTLSIGALGCGSTPLEGLNAGQRAALVNWLLGQQHQIEHPFTHAAPGGWAWTNLAGGVPDADDTAGALLALHALDRDSPETRAAAARGVEWLLDLQNRDGGIPTFCRGWSNLPFDRSCPDITAHVLAAWATWEPRLETRLRVRLNRAARRALESLLEAQRPDGAWIPLWFGNQHEARLENPVYGTSRVLLAMRRVRGRVGVGVEAAIARGEEWLRRSQREDGGWGGGGESPATVEETALALHALMTGENAGHQTVRRGLAWLASATQGGTVFASAPIGLYFAALWYAEELYPIIFSCGAFGCAEARRSSTGVFRCC